MNNADSATPACRPREWDLAGLLGDDLVRCSRCGFCQAVCPVYRETGEESATARGKLSLVEALAQGKIPPSRRLYDLFYRCLVCRACADACPSGVPTDHIFLIARTVLATAPAGLGAKKIFLTAFERPRLVNLLVKVAGAAWPLFFRPSGFIRWPANQFGPLRGTRLPRLSGRPFLPRRDRAEDEKAGSEAGSKPGSATALFFAGCLINYAYAETGESAVRILERLGYRVIVPRDHRCCGTPLAVNGETERARKLAHQNLHDLASTPFDVLVTACPSCASTFRDLYPNLLAGTADADRAATVAAKTVHLVDVLGGEGARRLTVSPASSVLPGREEPFLVTYHDPCHLIHGGHPPARPREILNSLPWVRYVEMANAGSCCGGGGTFAYTHRELSASIASRKVDAILATGAAAVVTSCPGCVTQLREALARAGSSARVAHIADLMDGCGNTSAPSHPREPSDPAGTRRGYSEGSDGYGSGTPRLSGR